MSGLQVERAVDLSHSARLGTVFDFESTGERTTWAEQSLAPERRGYKGDLCSSFYRGTGGEVITISKRRRRKRIPRPRV